MGTLEADNHNKIIGFLESICLRKKFSKIFVVGDFNLSKVNWESSDSSVPIEQNFVDSFSELGLVQCIEDSTHIKGSTLDILLTNVPQNVSHLNVWSDKCVCKSDHYPITFDINIKVSRHKSSKRKCYNFKKADWDGLNNALRHTNWDSVLTCNEVEFAWINFKFKLFELMDKYIPKITVKNEFQPPWFDSDVYVLCRKKERLRAKFKRTNSDSDEILFRQARKDLKRLVSQKMRENFTDGDDNKISKKFWSHVKATTNCHRIPENIHLNTRFRSCPLQKAELFNEFFCDQFSNASDYNIPIDFANDNEYDIDFSHRIIRRFLSNINSNKAQGPDRIHGKVLKNCAGSISYPLSLLFRLSYNTGYIPSEWKYANVVPIHKKGSKNDVKNYRPISLTSLIMKTFERVVKDELLLRVSHKLSMKQHGFLAKRSCTSNLVTLCDSLALSLNENISVNVVYFDFAKAFDTVNHDLILHKLKHQYNIDGRMLKFIANYLHNRKQCVVIGNSSSTPRSVNSGVPQGSILGPILFVLFINDITTGLTSGTECALYADDTKIWREISNHNDSTILQHDIDFLKSWADANKMRFHPEKCKTLHVTNSRTTVISEGIDAFTYNLGTISIENISCE